VPIVVAALGIAGTIIGVALTQRQANTRDALAWQRQKEQCQRDDMARTFDHRRDAYVNFYEALRDMAFMIYNHGMGLADEPDASYEGSLPDGFQLPAYRSLQHLEVYATPDVALFAAEAYSKAWWWGHRRATAKMM
jgi:hypothetical protein